MRSNLVLLVILSLFLGSCASRKHAGKRDRDRTVHVPKRPGSAETRWDRADEKPAAPVTPSRTLNTEEYIRLYSSLAVEEMERSGVPASITLAQGILESGNGNSRLAREGNNHFGIKCGSSWAGRRTYKDDDHRNECFRAYTSVEASFRDHSEFLKRQRYAFLFDLDPTDYKAWAHGLKKAGYATNPKYPQLLINLVERYELYYFDRPRHQQNQKVFAKAEPQPATPTSSSQTGTSARPPLTSGGAKAPTTASTSTSRTNTATASTPGKSNTGPASPAQTVSPEPAITTTSHYYYTVKQGDTLFSISQRFNVSLDELRTWNKLSSNSIALGQELRVSR